MHFIWWVIWALVVAWFIFWPFASRKQTQGDEQEENKEKPSYSNKISETKLLF